MRNVFFCCTIDKFSINIFVITSARRLCNHLGLYVYVCVCVCMCVCVFVCEHDNSKNNKHLDVKFLHIHLPLPKEELIKFWCNLVEN